MTIGQKILAVFGVAFLLFGFSGCYVVGTYISTGNEIIAKSEAQKGSVSEVSNQYKRRADLVPGIVEIVKGSASHELEVLTAVTEARAKATATNIDVSKLANDPEAQKKFLDAQAQLSASMTRMFTMVQENYPTLVANAQFRDFQHTYEGTENRIAVARGDCVKATQAYNTLIQQGVFGPFVAGQKGFTQRPYFEATEAEQAVPKFSFDKKK